LTIGPASRYLDDVASSESAELVTGVSSKDPEVGLRAVASLRRLLEAVEELQVANAREQGWSWQRIAAVLGVSRQAVHQKYGKARRPAPRRRR
jgi:hypothetical protein